METLEQKEQALKKLLASDKTFDGWEERLMPVLREFHAQPNEKQEAAIQGMARCIESGEFPIYATLITFCVYTLGKTGHYFQKYLPFDRLERAVLAEKDENGYPTEPPQYLETIWENFYSQGA